MKENDKHKKDTFTVAGTNIDAVKRQNERSGMSYNEVKELIARTSGGHGTGIYSDTNIEEVKRKNQASGNNSQQE
ncbi:gamma-type small acid-soluble spore protein [Virgibacillus ndiopensis]|uniref:gamma-type small acid-soluble spore protein n=1 Tax=Virgibacillus ndiopensis TaxID=2004408 RepID=UPI000C0697FD|nr:gamma-type small acid-soluble spore protein [Virgibacillus ndiopensis]